MERAVGDDGSGRGSSFHAIHDNVAALRATSDDDEENSLLMPPIRMITQGLDERGGGGRSTLVWKVALGGRVLPSEKNWPLADPSCSRSGHCMCNNDRGDSVRLHRQSDAMSVVVGGDEFDGVLSGHLMTVGRKTGTDCSEDEQQEAGQQPV